MTKRPSESTAAHDEIAEFRRQAAELGFSASESDLEAYDDLEAPDEFIARMKWEDGRRSRRWRRRLATGVATAAAVAGAWIVADLPTVSPAVADTPPVLDYEFAAAVRIAFAPGEDPDALLDLLAEAAATTPEPEATGDIQHKQSENWFFDIDDDGSARIVPRSIETWLQPDGSLVTSEHPGEPLTADGRGIDDRPGPADSTDILPAGSIDPDFANNLPDDPEQLVDALLDNIACTDRTPGPTRSICLYREIIALYQHHVVPQRVAAALWTALKDETDFTALGSVEDRAGRPAVGISITDPENPQYRLVLIVSPDDGQLTGVEEILIRPIDGIDAAPPAVVAFTTYVRSERTDRAPS